MVLLQATDSQGSRTNHLHGKNMGSYKKMSHLTPTYLNGALICTFSFRNENGMLMSSKVYVIYFTV